MTRGSAFAATVFHECDQQAKSHLTVRMPEKACEATEDIRPRASELLRSTAFVCCLYNDAVHAVPTTTPACSAGANWYVPLRAHHALMVGTSSKKQLEVAWTVTILWSPARIGPSRQDKQNSTTTAPDASSTARGPRSLDTLLHVQTSPSSLCPDDMSGPSQGTAAPCTRQRASHASHKELT